MTLDHPCAPDAEGKHSPPFFLAKLAVPRIQHRVAVTAVKLRGGNTNPALPAEVAPAWGRPRLAEWASHPGPPAVAAPSGGHARCSPPCPSQSPQGDFKVSPFASFSF